MTPSRPTVLSCRACARQLGLTRLGRLRKHALAARVLAALQHVAAPDDARPPHAPGRTGADPLGIRSRPCHRHGRLSRTALVCWEVTDDAIERARRDLGPGRPDAWLCLRVYDVTDRIFDGTNAHLVEWPFIMRTGTTVSYATGRVSEHILRFTRLYEELKQGRVTESRLADVEARDNVFPDLDYRTSVIKSLVPCASRSLTDWYSTRRKRHAPGGARRGDYTGGRRSRARDRPHAPAGGHTMQIGSASWADSLPDLHVDAPAARRDADALPFPSSLA